MSRIQEGQLRRSRLMHTRALACCVGLMSLLFVTVGPAIANPPNVLLILVDDLGVEQLDFYGVGTQFAPTPNITALANDGLVFTNAWSNPVCSPTRVTIHTGRHSFRTGIGMAIQEGDEEVGMALEELTLPELLSLHAPTPYTTGAFGKWHMGDSVELGGVSAPNLAGYDHFEGVMRNLATQSYFSYQWTVNGVESSVNNYATTQTVDTAVAWTNSAPEPWLSYVSLNAVHSPWHWPPANLHTQDTSQEGDLAKYRAMTEALDNEIGRLLAEIDTTNTLIIFASDNGTPPEVVQPPFRTSGAKGTVFQGGILVPFVVTGDVVASTGQVDGLVNTTDIFASIGEIAGATIPGDVVHDSISFVPYFTNPGQASLREYAFADMFYPNGPGPYAFGQIGTRNSQYKYMRNSAGAEGLADLLADPYESTNLMLEDLTDDQADALDALKAHVDELLGLCSLGDTGDVCSINEDCCSGRCRGRGNRRRCRAITEF